jgi:hypothetical protein
MLINYPSTGPSSDGHFASVGDHHDADAQFLGEKKSRWRRNSIDYHPGAVE